MADTKDLALLMAFVLQELRKAGYQPEEVANLFSAENVRISYELQRKADAGKPQPNKPHTFTQGSGWHPPVRSPSRPPNG